MLIRDPHHKRFWGGEGALQQHWLITSNHIKIHRKGLQRQITMLPGAEARRRRNPALLSHYKWVTNMSFALLTTNTAVRTATARRDCGAQKSRACTGRSGGGFRKDWAKSAKVQANAQHELGKGSGGTHKSTQAHTSHSTMPTPSTLPPATLKVVLRALPQVHRSATIEGGAHRL